jgi:hypothetical protein
LPSGYIDNIADLVLPPQINERSTRAERMFAHRAKMAGKVYNRANGIIAGESPQIRSRNQLNRTTGYMSIAQRNRHTGKPHENAREIMRRTMSPLERRAFAAAVAANLADVRLAA